VRFHAVAALLFGVLPVAGCSSPQTTSAKSLDARDVDALKKKDGERVSVKGKVYSAHLAKSGKVFTLNLGPDGNPCLKAAVFRDDFEKWKGGTNGMKTAYEGKVVVIEGKVKLYQGSPEIVVNTPSQIELAAEGDK
jgi:exonuclease VII large subunit